MESEKNVEEASEIPKQSRNSIAILVNSIFMGNQHLIVNSTLTPAHATNLHLPLIKFDFIAPDHWAWVPISKGIIPLNEIGLKNYITFMGASTYTLIFIESGVYSGYQDIKFSGTVSHRTT